MNLWKKLNSELGKFLKIRADKFENRKMITFPGLVTMEPCSGST